MLMLLLPVRAIVILTPKDLSIWVLAYLAFVSAITLRALASDKSKAQQRQWRIPEQTLHLLEFAGGWPASFIGQRIFRHKTRKSEYQTAFWGIVFLHQYVALDVVNDWKWTQKVWETIGPLLEKIS